MAASLKSAAIERLAGSGEGPVNVLLVDDTPARLLTYRAILEPLGENLIEANSGTEALRQLMASECALILLDVNMPGMDGFETADLIHQHPRFERTPIIFVTAVNVSDLDRVRGYKLGAVDYVLVPIMEEILRSKVAVLCELYRKRRDLQAAYEQLAAANEALRLEKTLELKRLNESLQLANDQLASRNAQLQEQVVERENAEARLLELDRRKDEFLAMLAHELRNPLASLGNALSVFRLAATGPEPLREAMERQLGLLVRLIDDLLDAARISRGKLDLKRMPTTVKAILDSAVETVAPLLSAGRHPLETILPAQEIDMHADRERLSQVFSNLLSNAVKYSDADTPIRMTVAASDGRVEIAIEDRGIGLTPVQAERIFDLFAQIDTSVERSRGGLGIGLTLARSIVEMHGGSLVAHSDGLGTGSRFVVSLPLGARPPASAAKAPINEDVRPSGMHRRVLIVDDNHDAADTLAMMIELMGHDTRCIYDPRASAEEVAAFAPDIVFLDLGMPGRSGYEVARELRAIPDNAQLTLVAVTGWGQPEDRRRSAESGFDHHLVKPVDAAALRRICGALKP
ncbi:MAG: response regulator [Lysobacterales bacterium]